MDDLINLNGLDAKKPHIVLKRESLIKCSTCIFSLNINAPDVSPTHILQSQVVCRCHCKVELSGVVDTAKLQGGQVKGKWRVPCH
jgi:hypothetical protein